MKTILADAADAFVIERESNILTFCRMLECHSLDKIQK